MIFTTIYAVTALLVFHSPVYVFVVCAFVCFVTMIKDYLLTHLFCLVRLIGLGLGLNVLVGDIADVNVQANHAVVC